MGTVVQGHTGLPQSSRVLDSIKCPPFLQLDGYYSVLLCTPFPNLLPFSCQELSALGHLGGSVVERLPLAQGMIPDQGMESRIRLFTGSLLLPLCLL